MTLGQRAKSKLDKLEKPGTSMKKGEAGHAGLPDMKVSVRQVFGIDTPMEVPAYSQPSEFVPEHDPD